MTRTRSYDSSPYKRKSDRKSPKSTSRPSKWSTAKFSRIASGRSTRFGAPPPSNSRYFRSQRKLQPIHEETSSTERKRARPSSASRNYRDFDVNEDTFRENAEEETEQEEREDELFQWEEEETLVFALMHENGPEEFEHTKLTSLAHSIQTPFSSRSQELKQDIAQTLVPAVNRVKEVYRILDKTVDKKFFQGMSMFDDACVKMESVTMRENDELESSYLETQKNIKALFVQLDEAYGQRERLWTDFQQTVDECVDSTLEEMNAVPAKVERTIAALEKRSKELNKRDGGLAKAKGKMIEGLLGKL